MSLFQEEGAAGAPGSYLALARKYRPAAFEEVIGQGPAVSTLKNAVAAGRLHHAYLFSGIRGVGKTTAARLFARAVNCAKGPTVNPCGECDPCREIASGLSMDVIEIDAASNRGVADVEPLREAARYAPSRDRYKIFILDEVHMLSNAAFNSLLKILEEPPPRIIWILATTEYRKVPPTVVSRCQHFEFHRVPRAEIVQCLARICEREKVDVEPVGLEIIATAAAGSVRDAVSLLDQTIAYAGARATAEDVRNAIGAIDRGLLIRFLRLVSARDPARLLDLIASLAAQGVDFSQFAAGLLQTIRDATLARYAGASSASASATAEEEKDLREIASGFSDDGLLRVFNALLDLPFALRNAPQPRFVLEAAALRLARLADLSPIEEVIARLQGGAAPAARQGPAPGAGPAFPGPTEAAQAGPGVTSAGTEGFRDRFLAAVQSRKMSFRTYLVMALRITLDGDGVEIVLPEKQRSLLESIATAEARTILESAATEVAERAVTVRISFEASPAGAPTGSDAPRGPEKRDRLIEAAMQQPGVKLAMEAFKGQIVDIQEMP